MKNKLLLFLVLIVVLFIGTELFGYSTSQGAEIRKAHLSKRDQMLLHAGGAKQVLVFSYRVPEHEMTHLDYWIEVYKNGKDLGKKFSSKGRISGTAKGMIAFAIEPPETKKDRWGRWIISDFNKQGSEQSILTKKMKPLQGSTMTTENPGEKIKAGKTISLAAIIRDPDNSMMAMPDLRNRQSLIQLSRGNKTVLVLSCRFSK